LRSTSGKTAIAVTVCFLLNSTAFADCSVGKKIACAFVEAGCVPAALGGRDAYLQCISKVTGHGCDECIGIGGSPGSPICWDGSSSQLAGDCGGGSQPSVSGTFGLTVPVGYVAPTLAANEDGHLEFFGQTASGISHYWQQSPSGAWQAPGSEFPGSPTSPFAPMVVRHIDGRLQLFVVAADQSVHRINQIAPNVNWGTWNAIPGVAAIAAPGATIDSNGQTSLVVLAANHEVYLTTNSSADAAMSPWQSLGGSLSGAPAIAVNADGRREVFAVGTDGTLLHTWEFSPGGAWSSWASFGGSFAGAPTVASNADGRLEVFVTTRAGVLRHLWQVTPSAGWSGWSDFPGSHKFAVSVLPNLNLTLTVYAVGVGDGAVYYTMQSVSTGGWTDWKSLGGTALSAPRVALNTDGTLEILAVGLDHGIWHNRQKTTDSIDWLGWQKIGGNSFNDSF